MIETPPQQLLAALTAHFCDVLELSWRLPKDIETAALEILDPTWEKNLLAPKLRSAGLVALINSKFRVNATPLADFFAAAAERKQPLHYHDKQEVQTCFDTCDSQRLRRLLLHNKYDLSLLNFVRPVAPEDTLRLLRQRLHGEPGITESALRSLFGGYFFHSFPPRNMHPAFNLDCRELYCADFFDHLKTFYSDALHRDCALSFLNIDPTLYGQSTTEEFRDKVFAYVKETYDRLGNHCYFAVRIEPLTRAGESEQWRLFADLILYAEKFRENQLDTGYFHPEKVASETLSCILTLDEERAAFRVANEGFFFKDCFIIRSTTADASDKPYDLLLLFEKNERDERVIPCPACRTLDVRGNSYPFLGVKSWECQNVFCPERSAFDRGNRYSLASLIKQEAIRVEENQIPEDSLRKWKLDIASCNGIEQMIDMLIRHFSLHGDAVDFVNVEQFGSSRHGRTIRYSHFEKGTIQPHIYRRFKDSAFFHRYLVDRPLHAKTELHCIVTGTEGLELIQGDCVDVLRELPAEKVDGAVTSPPYYNARSYSQWPNIYGYLYDMYNMAKEVFRVLKPGAVYLFNIFDYFDNENNIVFSAMGKKRMILGAYVLDIFSRVGFHVEGNVVWNKGEIEGKRAFNQGNFSPYYQLPLNCWEHIFVFRKPGEHPRKFNFPAILTAPPVRKFLRGQNRHGHSAPFPDDIPHLLLRQMNRGDIVLDPYSGSMTTGRVAHALGINSISIELHSEYCDLSVGLLRQDNGQLGLLSDANSMLNGKALKPAKAKGKRLNARLSDNSSSQGQSRGSD